MAEAHPVGFRWVVEARERGATVIHVDPRYSRTSALADLWLPIRAGGDLAFLGGLVRWVLEEERYFADYVRHYTNASFLVGEAFRDTEELDGLFSGFDPALRSYDASSWGYERDAAGEIVRDPTLLHPRCVFQVLKRHFARYTPEMVERVAGVPAEQLLRVARALADNSGPEKTSAICYAVGWTQHSKGVQIIRTAAILQLLLGNIGRPGGGILALRGHASIQGSTDIPTLYDLLPGYLPMPDVRKGDATLVEYLARVTKREGWWANAPAYVVSLLKAYYGDAAGEANDFGFAHLPRIAGNHSHLYYMAEMADGAFDGLFVMGQNPAVAGQGAAVERKALTRLKWLVVRDLVEIETASFWYDAPEVQRGDWRPEEIGTEVFLFPAAGHAEKAGAFTQTQRLLQWREKAVEPPGDARSEAWFIHQIARRLIARAHEADDSRDAPLRTLDWWYPEDGHGEPVMEAVLAEINGWQVSPNGLQNFARPEDAEAARLASASEDGVLFATNRGGLPHHGRQVEGFHELRADGSTACGCWIYSGVYGPDGVNRAARREAEGPYGHGWGFAWPADRRILYNRASARPDGTPWSEAKRLLWWDEETRRWTGHDVPDFPADKPPGYAPTAGAGGVAAHPGDAPFLMHPEGVGRLFVPEGLADGPLPTHYEPFESPIGNPLYGTPTNPVADRMERDDNRYASSPDPRFPYVLTTYRLTEHHTAGGMSRTLSHLAELQPELFAELSPELAHEVGVANGDHITVATARGAITARALVTRRIRPLRLGDHLVHQVAMPFHWGSHPPLAGDTVNDLIPLSAEPNVSIHESKALLCTVRPHR